MAYNFQTAVAAIVLTLPSAHTHRNTHTHTHKLTRTLLPLSQQTKGPADVKPFERPKSELLLAHSDDASVQFACNIFVVFLYFYIIKCLFGSVAIMIDLLQQFLRRSIQQKPCSFGFICSDFEISIHPLSIPLILRGSRGAGADPSWHWM